MAMLEDAQRLTPGGVGGIRRPYNFVIGEYPVFITHGKGGHIFDVDGNEYIDMLCAYGPIILGYVEHEINDAAKAQMDKGFCFSLVQPLQNELEQRLADLMPCGEQTILVKSGSDATNAAVRRCAPTPAATSSRAAAITAGATGASSTTAACRGRLRAHQGVRVRRARRPRAHLRREPRPGGRRHHHPGRPPHGQADHHAADGYLEAVMTLPRQRRGAHLRRDAHRLSRRAWAAPASATASPPT